MGTSLNEALEKGTMIKYGSTLKLDPLITSDLHLLHPSILNFTNRPDPDYKTMTYRLIDEINKTVDENDSKMLIHLGDFSFVGKQKTLELIERIQCQSIIFVNGNHDKTMRNLMRTGELDPARYAIFDYLELNDLDGDKVCLFHYPINHWNRVKHGAYHIHGHTHSFYDNGPRSHDAGYDQNNRFLLLSEAKKIAMGKPVGLIPDIRRYIKNWWNYRDLKLFKK